MKPFTLFILTLTFTSLTAAAHPGGVDKNGGHIDKKTGKYHIHKSPPPKTPSKSTPKKK